MCLLAIQTKLPTKHTLNIFSCSVLSNANIKYICSANAPKRFPHRLTSPTLFLVKCDAWMIWFGQLSGRPLPHSKLTEAQGRCSYQQIPCFVFFFKSRACFALLVKFSADVVFVSDLVQNCFWWLTCSVNHIKTAAGVICLMQVLVFVRHTDLFC